MYTPIGQSEDTTIVNNSPSIEQIKIIENDELFFRYPKNSAGFIINKGDATSKDIFDLINMDPISKKFEQLMSDNSKYNGADDNNEYQDYNNYDNDYNDYDYDYRDDVGDPIYDY